MRRTTAWSSLVIAALFSYLWIAALLPLMRTGNRIEHLYSVYILDLVFVMPAFALTALMSLRLNNLGMALAPVMMITVFFIIFPLGLGRSRSLTMA